MTWPSAGAPSSIFKPILSYISHTKPTSYEKVLREVVRDFIGNILGFVIVLPSVVHHGGKTLIEKEISLY